MRLRRRKFITLLGGAAATWPLAARAQQHARMPVMGFISSGAPGPLHHQLIAFREGLKETGFIESEDVTVEYRFAEGQPDRFPALVSDLVHRPVSVLAVTSIAGAQAAKKAATTTPIVFSAGDDPVAAGLVDSLKSTRIMLGLETKRLSSKFNSSGLGASITSTQLTIPARSSPGLPGGCGLL